MDYLNHHASPSLSRSTWACELKYNVYLQWHWHNGHAPRERVSWNFPLGILNDTWSVTLHVSVWVEIFTLPLPNQATLSRSTWACELKCYNDRFTAVASCHAPRERVSWNVVNKVVFQTTVCHAPRERVSWNRPYIGNSTTRDWSRSTWACELKFSVYTFHCQKIRHAPRERVSWNSPIISLEISFRVTLHVSVWVEIKYYSGSSTRCMSRSTWACELKLCNRQNKSLSTGSRSTWACELKFVFAVVKRGRFKSRSTWACELK